MLYFNLNSAFAVDIAADSCRFVHARDLDRKFVLFFLIAGCILSELLLNSVKVFQKISIKNVLLPLQRISCQGFLANFFL